MTKRKRLWMQAAKSFLFRVARLTLTYWVRSTDIQREIAVELLLSFL